jgi:hypothetical protein
MHGTRRLMACAANVPAMWSRRLLRQIKEQARPRAFPSNRPSLDRPYKERGMNWVWCYADGALLDPI